MEVEMLSMFFDPRFKEYPNCTPAERKEYSEKAAMMAKSQVLSEPLEQKAERKLDVEDLFGLPSEIPDIKEDSEVERYKNTRTIGSSENPLKWWRENAPLYPRVASLAKKYLGIPATSAPSERAFSTASNVDSRHRGRLDPESLEMCVLLHHHFLHLRDTKDEEEPEEMIPTMQFIEVIDM